MIIVKPNGGLGNRMRVINSAICLSKNNNTSLKVLWKKDPGMNAAFADIFMPLNGVSVITNNLLMGHYFYSRKLLPSGYKYYDDQAILTKRFDENYWSSDHSKVIVNTCYDFYYPSVANNFFGIFQPVKRIRDRINEITRYFSEDFVGVHIRRTDHEISREKSSTVDFICRMDNLIQENPNTKFYLSTDDPSTELQLKERYLSGIFCLQDKSTNRNELCGIEDAVVDLFCLSNTKIILGSYLSSFSEVASAIGKMPLETIIQK